MGPTCQVCLALALSLLQTSVCVCVCVYSAFYFLFFIILYVNCFGRTMLYMCIEYHI